MARAMNKPAATAALAIGIAMLVCLLAGLQPGPGDASAQTAGADDKRRLDNKLKLLKSMAYNSPVARRIENAAGAEQARAQLQKARNAYEQAQQHLQYDELEAAETALNQGLHTFGRAARSAADPQREQALERERYQELYKRIRSFSDAFSRIAEEKGRTLETILDENAIKTHLNEAQKLRSRGRYKEANQRLVRALAKIEQALSKARHRETLIRTLQFGTLEEEYAYELERNRSHHMLVQLMLAERDTLTDSSRIMIAQFVARSGKAREQAAYLAHKNDMRAALDTLEQGTMQLVRALRVLGMPF